MKLQMITFTLGLATVASNAGAALVGVVQTFPDVTLGTNVVIYDHNGVDANTGLLRVVSRSSTLNTAPLPGGAAFTQTYNHGPTGDLAPDSMFTVAVDNSTGNFVAGSAHNKLTVGFGNTSAVGNPAFDSAAGGFRWLGDITDFGFLVTQTGNNFQLSFDGRLNVTSDSYRNLPAGFASFLDGSLSNVGGGFKINIATSNSTGNHGGVVSGWSSVNDGVSIFGQSWIYGTSVRAGASAVNDAFFNTTNGQFNPFLIGTGITATSANTFNGTVTANVWVPLPAAVWLLGTTMAGLGVVSRRRLS